MGILLAHLAGIGVGVFFVTTNSKYEDFENPRFVLLGVCLLCALIAGQIYIGANLPISPPGTQAASQPPALS